MNKKRISFRETSYPYMFHNAVIRALEVLLHAYTMAALMTSNQEDELGDYYARNVQQMFIVLNVTVALLQSIRPAMNVTLSEYAQRLASLSIVTETLETSQVVSGVFSILNGIYSMATLDLKGAVSSAYNLFVVIKGVPDKLAASIGDALQNWNVNPAAIAWVEGGVRTALLYGAPQGFEHLPGPIVDWSGPMGVGAASISEADAPTLAADNMTCEFPQFRPEASALPFGVMGAEADSGWWPDLSIQFATEGIGVDSNGRPVMQITPHGSKGISGAAGAGLKLEVGSQACATLEIASLSATSYAVVAMENAGSPSNSSAPGQSGVYFKITNVEGRPCVSEIGSWGLVPTGPAQIWLPACDDAIQRGAEFCITTTKSSTKLTFNGEEVGKLQVSLLPVQPLDSHLYIAPTNSQGEPFDKATIVGWRFDPPAGGCDLPPAPSLLPVPKQMVIDSNNAPAVAETWYSRYLSNNSPIREMDPAAVSYENGVATLDPAGTRSVPGSGEIVPAGAKLVVQMPSGSTDVCATITSGPDYSGGTIGFILSDASGPVLDLWAVQYTLWIKQERGFDTINGFPWRGGASTVCVKTGQFLQDNANRGPQTWSLVSTVTVNGNFGFNRYRAMTPDQLSIFSVPTGRYPFDAPFTPGAGKIMISNIFFPGAPGGNHSQPVHPGRGSSNSRGLGLGLGLGFGIPVALLSVVVGVRRYQTGQFPRWFPKLGYHLVVNADDDDDDDAMLTYGDHETRHLLAPRGANDDTRSYGSIVELDGDQDRATAETN